MMYICAWQAAPLQPSDCTVSRIAAAAESGRPEPPYSSGISTERYPASVSARDELGRVAAHLVQLAPVFAGEPGAEFAHFLADFGVRVGEEARCRPLRGP